LESDTTHVTRIDEEEEEELAMLTTLSMVLIIPIVYPLPIYAKTSAGHSILWNYPYNIQKLCFIPTLETFAPVCDRNLRKYKTLY